MQIVQFGAASLVSQGRGFMLDHPGFIETVGSVPAGFAQLGSERTREGRLAENSVAGDLECLYPAFAARQANS